MKQTFYFNELFIHEWYDGVVRAVGVSNEKSYLVALVAWSLKTKAKIYLILDLDSSRKREIITALDAGRSKDVNWTEYSKLFDSYLNEYRGDMYLFLGEMERNLSLEVRPISESRLLNSVVPYDLENALDRATFTSWHRVWSCAR